MTEMPNKTMTYLRMHCKCMCVGGGGGGGGIGMTEMPNKTMTYLRIHCNSFPMVLNIHHSFSNFEATLTYFNHI